MCGRFTRGVSIEEVAMEFEANEVACDLTSSYNVAPTQKVVAIVEGDDGKGRRVVAMRWGLVPSWAPDLSMGDRMINARAETVTEKVSFKRAFNKRRCLVVADGFYEWQKIGDGKRPFYIRLKSQRPFGIAGLYDHWKSPDGEEVISCALITTKANGLMEPIHERMPVIIPKEFEKHWLDASFSDKAFLQNILLPYADELMEAYEVSKRVNSPANNTPDCILPAPRAGA